VRIELGGLRAEFDLSAEDALEVVQFATKKAAGVLPTATPLYGGVGGTTQNPHEQAINPDSGENGLAVPADQPSSNPQVVVPPSRHVGGWHDGTTQKPHEQAISPDLPEKGVAIPSKTPTAARIRAVATEVLADGKPHLRREIFAALRDAGVPTGNLDNSLRHHNDFIWGKDEEGRAIYTLEPMALADAGSAVDVPPDADDETYDRAHRRALADTIVANGKGPKMLGSLNGGS
jgi:hypothetical protein